MAMEFARISQVMTEVGPLLDEVMIEEFEAEQAWHIVFNEDLQVLITLDEAQDRLVLSSEIGRPPVDRRQDIYELLLITNMMWQETGGLQFGLGSPEGDAVMQFFVPANQASGELHGIVVQFVERASVWRHIVETGGTRTAGQSSEEIVAGAIRA